MFYKCLACESKMASIFNSGQFSGLPTELPTISLPESSGLPTELSITSVYGSSGQPYLHGKIPMGSPLHCQLSCPLFHILEVLGCPMSCPLFPYMEEVGSLICMAKFSWAAHGQPTPLPTELPTFKYLEAVGCLLSCPLFPYMEVVGSLICMAKFPWEAHGQRSEQLPCFFSVWADTDEGADTRDMT